METKIHLTPSWFLTEDVNSWRLHKRKKYPVVKDGRIVEKTSSQNWHFNTLEQALNRFVTEYPKGAESIEELRIKLEECKEAIKTVKL